MRKTAIWSAILTMGVILLAGCSNNQVESASAPVYEYGNKDSEAKLRIAIVEDFELEQYKEKYEEPNFVDLLCTRLNLQDTYITVSDYTVAFSEGKLSHLPIEDAFDYVILAAGSGDDLTWDSLDSKAIQSAYEEELRTLLAACPSAKLICAYDYYALEYEAGIESALQSVSTGDNIYAIDLNQYDYQLNRGSLPDVHKRFAEVLRRQINGIESLKNANLDPSKPVVALTFDDGPNTTTTMQVLDILEEKNIVASFFLIGQNIDAASAKSASRALSLGCEINSHSNTHSYMNKMTAEEILEDMSICEQKIYEAVGVYPSFFRPPYIAVSSEMYANIDLPFICGFGCNDWDSSVSAKTRADKVIADAKDGEIFLLHDAAGNDQTVEALPTIIDTLLEQGYQFATCTQLFALKNIVPTGKHIYTNCMESVN